MPPTKFNVTPVRCNKEPLLRTSARSGADASFFVGSRDHRFDIAGRRRSTIWDAAPAGFGQSVRQRTNWDKEMPDKGDEWFSHSVAD
jgi:hypothetical protein